jgi:membrane fusion protein, multidrug efflux system
VRTKPWMGLLVAGLAVAFQTRLEAQGVEVVTVSERRVERASRLPAELLPFQQVSICSRVTGFVEKIEVDRGSVVRKGQLLIVLTAPEMSAQLMEAEAKIQALESQRVEAQAKLLASESTYERLKAASSTAGAVAGHELLLAQKTVEAHRAMIAALESTGRAARASAEAIKDLQDYLNLAAPFDGTITRRSVHPGALVGPGSGAPAAALLELEQSSRLRLVVAVPETLVAGILPGATLSFRVPAYPARSFSGVVARASRSLDPKTRTMPLELDVPNPEGLLAPGMYAEVEWVARGAAPSLLVPPTSVVTTTERSFVIRVRDGRAEWVTVSRGAAAGDLVEVFGALRSGDAIVRRGSDEIRDGASLQILPSPR